MKFEWVIADFFLSFGSPAPRNQDLRNNSTQGHSSAGSALVLFDKTGFSPNRDIMSRLVRRGVSKGVEDGRRPPTLWASHHQNGLGAKGLGMAGLGET
jgi:hypothetical protein